MSNEKMICNDHINCEFDHWCPHARPHICKYHLERCEMMLQKLNTKCFSLKLERKQKLENICKMKKY